MLSESLETSAALPTLCSDHGDAPHCVRLKGGQFQPRPSGALWHAQSGTLIVSDLHLEKASAYARRGQMLPPYDTAETLRRLELEIAALKPDCLVCLGDSLHDAQAADRMAATDLDRIAGIAAAQKTVWIIGNHDDEGLDRLPGQMAQEWWLGEVALRHEPWSATSQASGAAEICGHLHPALRLAGGGRAMRRRCFAISSGCMIMPAFGAYAGGLNVLDPAFQPMKTSGWYALALGAARLYPIHPSQMCGD